ncbi:MAG TPA: cyclic 2,3-diphosphoglycerate synthase [Candidatus Rifleibacterium sp.]|nr:cyclic 2,3-diphosphoglycerate synthase [Candidatus Rifleibacterium sp.]HPT46005.1 cyclic 2,3-diphosphoglycerate synthase [Candidatus Rifleibacterium sp.]
MAIRTIIMGAAGRDFHNFNMVYRNNPTYEVVAFTATQIPDIDGRMYPAELAGKGYPKGIPIESEDKLLDLIKKHNVQEVVFSYSDVPHEYIMHHASKITAAGASFKLLGYQQTAIKCSKPVISICAVRTGCGKSQTTRAVVKALKEQGLRVVSVRHPMPYGDLKKQICQRFASYKDLDLHKCTIEEREEYEPHIDIGAVIYSGVDYEVIARNAEKEADVIVWDGGNNDFPFFLSDLKFVVADPHRPGHEAAYYPGEANVYTADVVVINKIDSANPEDINYVRDNIFEMNPTCQIIDAASPIFVEGWEKIRGKRVVVIEDGPTLTHGEMTIGAGIVAAQRYGAGEIVDPKPYFKGTILAALQKYPHIGDIIPALGYGKKQTDDLEKTINACDCDLVISATPIDITRVVKVKKPCLRVGYELQEIGRPTVAQIVEEFLGKGKKPAKAAKAEKPAKAAKKAK